MAELQFDPELASHIEELTAMAKEVGALGAMIIRKPTLARLFFNAGSGIQAQDLAGQTAPPAGVLVILFFPASDGGGSGVEVK